LQLLDRDPFLGVGNFNKRRSAITRPKVQRSVAPKSRLQENRKKTKPKKMVNWPEITYHGWINRVNDFKKTGVLTIEGNQVNLTSGEEYKDFKVMKIADDSIQLYYKDSIRYIK